MLPLALREVSEFMEDADRTGRGREAIGLTVPASETELRLIRQPETRPIGLRIIRPRSGPTGH